MFIYIAHVWFWSQNIPCIRIIYIFFIVQPQAQDVKPDPNVMPQVASIIAWSPPQANWNAWTACNIDEGYLANTDLDQLSNDLEQDYRARLQTDNKLKDMMNFRSKLPVHEIRNQIVNMVNERPVIVVRGKQSHSSIHPHESPRMNSDRRINWSHMQFV